MRGAVITVDALNLDAAKPFLDLAQAAMRADRLRRERAAALKERQETICVHEEEPDPDSRRPGIGPCWKGGYSDPLSGEWEHDVPREDWCENCEKRQKAHELYMSLGRPLGVARRKVSHLAKKAEKVLA